VFFCEVIVLVDSSSNNFYNWSRNVVVSGSIWKLQTKFCQVTTQCFE
jgi:hypothetical protein